MRVLGIETSCDETGIAIYDSEQGLLSHQLYSQDAMHAEFGGVVPELASRDHIRKITPLLDQALKDASCTRDDIDGIGYTAGPGLVGALFVGACVGRALGWAWDVPTVPVHHMEGHLLAPMLEDNPPAFPFLALLVSGGHTLLVNVKALGAYEVLGESLDDAVGEAFDKTAKLMGLGYPGGAILAKLADAGDASAYVFPRPMTGRPGLEFSFSGLKTFTRNLILSEPDDDVTRANIAASFQEAVVDTLGIKCKRAIKQTGLTRLVIAGGVSANLRLREKLKVLCAQLGVEDYYPRIEFCTDNGAMIAYTACQHLLNGDAVGTPIEVFPRWAL